MTNSNSIYIFNQSIIKADIIILVINNENNNRSVDKLT